MSLGQIDKPLGDTAVVASRPRPILGSTSTCRLGRWPSLGGWWGDVATGEDNECCGHNSHAATFLEAREMPCARSSPFSQRSYSAAVLLLTRVALHACPAKLASKEGRAQRLALRLETSARLVKPAKVFAPTARERSASARWHGSAYPSEGAREATLAESGSRRQPMPNSKPPARTF